MKRQVLGLDINEEYVAAAVIASGGNDRVVTAAALAKLDHRVTLADVLPPLLEKVGWKDGASVCGISLSGVSLRNLTIPFTCLLYTSPSPRDRTRSRMPSSA